LARVAAEQSGAALGWRRRWCWWGDGAMAAPALSCRVGRERELDRSCAGGLSGVCSLSNFRLARSRLYPLARVAAEESGAGLGWRRRWWGDGAMAAPALSCRVGRKRELDRSFAGGLSGVCSLSNFRLASLESKDEVDELASFLKTNKRCLRRRNHTYLFSARSRCDSSSIKSHRY
jgi:hypothetical protein